MMGSLVRVRHAAPPFRASLSPATAAASLSCETRGRPARSAGPTRGAGRPRTGGRAFAELDDGTAHDPARFINAQARAAPPVKEGEPELPFVFALAALAQAGDLLATHQAVNLRWRHTQEFAQKRGVDRERRFVPLQFHGPSFATHRRGSERRITGATKPAAALTDAARHRSGAPRPGRKPS